MFQPGEGRPWPEVATVIAGLNSRLKDSPRGESLPVIHIADISRARYERHELRRVRLDGREGFERLAARAGDIVMAARGYVLCAAIAPEAWDGALLSSNVVSIRPTGVLRPEVLLFLLNTKEARTVYEKRSGAGALMLSPRSFDHLHIPVPHVSKQTTMTALLRLREREAALVEQLIEKRKGLVNALLLRSLCNQ
jgi:hypothetical protein